MVMIVRVAALSFVGGLDSLPTPSPFDRYAQSLIRRIVAHVRDTYVPSMRGATCCASSMPHGLGVARPGPNQEMRISLDMGSRVEDIIALSDARRRGENLGVLSSLRLAPVGSFDPGPRLHMVFLESPGIVIRKGALMYVPITTS